MQDGISAYDQNAKASGIGSRSEAQMSHAGTHKGTNPKKFIYLQTLIIVMNYMLL